MDYYDFVEHDFVLGLPILLAEGVYVLEDVIVDGLDSEGMFVGHQYEDYTGVLVESEGGETLFFSHQEIIDPDYTE